jgi:hypothetical protein
MKKGLIVCISLFILSSTVLHAVVVREVRNKSQDCDIILRSVIIPGLKQQFVESTHDKNSVVLPGQTVQTAKYYAFGNDIRVIVVEHSEDGSSICKKYRLFVDVEKKQLLLQRKDACMIGMHEYDTYATYDIDPNHCVIDMELAENDTTALQLYVLSEEEEKTSFAKRVKKTAASPKKKTKVAN